MIKFGGVGSYVQSHLMRLYAHAICLKLTWDCSKIWGALQLNHTHDVINPSCAAFRIILCRARQDLEKSLISRRAARTATLDLTGVNFSHRFGGNKAE